jgi:hypothetical protein
MHFNDRESNSRIETKNIVQVLLEKNILSNPIETMKEVDISGTDFFIDYKDSTNLPIQFKLRKDKWQDIPICRFQPFRGYEQSTIGRDYKSLKEKKNKLYFVASMNENKKYSHVSITSTDKILELIDEAEKEWFSGGDQWIYFNCKIYNDLLDKKIWNKKLKTSVNGVEAWFKKNYSESFGKINYYIPASLADEQIKII